MKAPIYEAAAHSDIRVQAVTLEAHKPSKCMGFHPPRALLHSRHSAFICVAAAAGGRFHRSVTLFTILPRGLVRARFC